jgi:formylglycine-generating enzyme required for sulfatase activity
MEFDVFLCHNSQDKEEIIEIAEKLEEKALKPWLDEWALQPGLPWQPELEYQIQNIKAAAVFVGESGIGPWQEMEISAYLREFIRRKCPVIPVLLPNVGKTPELPLFLRGNVWVDFRRTRPDPMERLIWGITGIKPGPKSAQVLPQPNPIKSNPTQETQPNTIDLGNGITLEMVSIPGGSFLMGSMNGDDDEKPQHEVTIKPFCMGKYPITQEQWRAIASRNDLKIAQDLDPNPARFKDKPDSDRRPVERVSWDDATEYCARLSKLTERNFRLPSEAEWEYACRAGTTTAYSFGDNINEKLANYGRNIGETTPVGKYSANQFGLYDMHGNAWEWCADYWHSNYENAPTDGREWLAENDGNNLNRVLRGGSWGDYPGLCRSASRNYLDSGTRFDYDGFRVVCSASRTS